MKKYFITGIDTSCGKTYATGLISKYLSFNGYGKITTMKAIQTGATPDSISPDVIEHRRIMNKPISDIDKDLVTSPYVFKYACSPHLAAALEKQIIYLSKISDSITYLEQFIDTLVIEGAGGILTPLTQEISILDFIKELHGCKTILVSSSKLGSINHTVLSIKEILRHKDIYLSGVIFNEFLHDDPVISDSSYEYLTTLFPEINFVKITNNENSDYDFSKIL